MQDGQASVQIDVEKKAAHYTLIKEYIRHTKERLAYLERSDRLRWVLLQHILHHRASRLAYGKSP